MRRFLLLSLASCALASALATSASHAEAQEPAKRRVLILGDSISIGYTPFVKELLKEQAEVVRPEGNCEGTTRGVKELDGWLALGGGKWDVIHFNFGLHDLKAVDPTTGQPSAKPEHPRQADPDKYERQLREITLRLKKTGAKLIFATTTPVPEGKVSPHRVPADVPRYNERALKVMKEQGAAVDDLYSFTLPRSKEIQLPANVHFTPAGYKALAGEVATQIKTALAQK